MQSQLEMEFLSSWTKTVTYLLLPCPNSEGIPSLLLPLWGPDIVDPLAANLKWLGEREKDHAARLCL